MKAFIVYCHPSEDSFTSHVRDSFIKGIVDSGNEYEISDLYKMNFKTDMSEQDWDKNLKAAYEKGRTLFQYDIKAKNIKMTMETGHNKNYCQKKFYRGEK